MLKRLFFIKTLFIVLGLLFATQAMALGSGSGNTTTNGCTMNTAYLGQNNQVIRFSANSYCGSVEIFDNQGATYVPYAASNSSTVYHADSEENGFIYIPIPYLQAGNPVTFTIRAHDPQDYNSVSQSTVNYGGGFVTSCLLTSFSYNVSAPGSPNVVNYNYTPTTTGGFVCKPVFNGVQNLNSPIYSNFVGGVNGMYIWAVPPGSAVGGSGSFVSDFITFNYPGGAGGGTGPAPEVTLTANPTAGQAGTVNPTLTWTVFNGASTCDASGDWSGNKSVTGGNQTTGVLNLVKLYTFTLTCVNAYGQDSATATVDVSPGSPTKDLIASTPTPTGATMGVAQTFTSTITNQGSSSTVSGFTNLFQISQYSDGTSPTDYPVPSMAALAGNGGSAVTSKSITFPSVGAWYIRVCADKSSAADTNGAIAEINETNNCSMSTPWTQVTVAAPNSPDLIASDPTPATATVGVAQNFTSTISNVGPVSTGAGFTNLFQISQSSTGASGVTDYPVSGMSALVGGGYANTTKSITFPSVGTWYMRVCADKSSAGDTDGSITEYSETNNCSMSTPWATVNVTAQPVPVVTITANPTSGVVNVVNPTLTWSATNSPTSCTASGDWSGTKAVSGSGVAQGVLSSVRTYTYTLNCTNANGVGSNASATVVVSSSAGIDLTAGGVAPGSAVLNTSTSFSATVQNIGNTNSGASINVLFQTSPNASTATDAGYKNTPALAGGNSAVVSQNITLTSSGTQYVRACADKKTAADTGLITESDESNNCGPWTAVVVAASGPDLISATPTFASTPQVGAYAPTMTAVVTNIGNVTTGTSFWVRAQVDNDSDHSIIATGLPYGNSNVAVAGGNASTTVTLNNNNFQFPSAGTYYIQACADQNVSGVGLISETDETNNCSPWTTIQIGPSGSISGNPCVISAGASTCNSSVTWNTSNPITTSVVKNSANSTITTANSGTMNMTVKYPSETFTLYNNSASLASDVVESSCATGTSWSTSSGMCKVNSGVTGDQCANGAANFPACTCTTASCTACVNGAANPPSCTCTTASCDFCVNGAANPPSCTCTTASCTACLNGLTNPPSCTNKNPIFKEN